MHLRPTFLTAFLLMTLATHAATTFAAPSLEAPEKEILSVTPPLSFAVDSGLEKNRRFWVSIYTRYYTYQGLIHDASGEEHFFAKLTAVKVKEIRSRYVRGVFGVKRLAKMFGVSHQTVWSIIKFKAWKSV